MKLKVLWTIAGSMGTYSDIEMLKKAKAFDIEAMAADNEDKDAAGFLITGQKCIIPKPKEHNYIDKLLELCKLESITTIIPQYTDELEILSENLNRFEALGIKVLVTEDTELLKVANSKLGLYQFFSNSAFVPGYLTTSTMEGVQAAARELGYPVIPICIKPAQGEGGKGFRILTEEKLNIFEDTPGSPKMSLGAYLNQLSVMDKIPELIVSEYLPGKEYSVDCVCKEGKTYLCIPRLRMETSMGVSSVSVVENIEELIAYSKEIIAALKLSYNINLQFKYSAAGMPKLLEINPRVSGALVANFGAGVNMLEASLKLAYGMPLECPDIKWGTKMIRYWGQLFLPS